MTARSRIRSAAHSARWFFFAKSADDRRRAAYWKAFVRLRKRQVAERRSCIAVLPEPAVAIPPETSFTTAAPGTIEFVPKVVAEVRAIRRTLGLSGQGVEKPYLFDHPITDLEPSSALLSFALDRHVVAAAAQYLGMVPMLTGITILVSPHVPGPIAGSQMFHSDWEDVRQVKVFVHCSPVGEENGPLTAISGAASRRVKERLGYRYGGSHFRLCDDQVNPIVSPDEVTALTGPTGAVTFIDTSTCLHFGSRVEPGADERLVVQFQYLTPAAFDLAFRRRPRLAGQAARKDALDRLLLG